jgi:hypothetical protein
MRRSTGSLERNPVIGDSPLFPALRGGRPWTRHQAKELLHRAERLAGLAPLDGGDFHPTDARGRRCGSICPSRT